MRSTERVWGFQWFTDLMHDSVVCRNDQIHRRHRAGQTPLLAKAGYRPLGCFREYADRGLRCVEGARVTSSLMARHSCTPCGLRCVRRSSANSGSPHPEITLAGPKYRVGHLVLTGSRHRDRSRVHSDRRGVLPRPVSPHRWWLKDQRDRVPTHVRGRYVAVRRRRFQVMPTRHYIAEPRPRQLSGYGWAEVTAQYAW